MKFSNKSKLASAISSVVITLIFSGFNCIAQTNDNPGEISYSITIDESNMKLATVEMSFVPKDSIIYMVPGANQFPKRWAKFVDNIKAINSKGKLITVEELPDARWKMHTPSGERITVSYEVTLDHEEYKWGPGIDGIAYAKDWGVFYTGKALFIVNGDMMNADTWGNIKVNFSIPQNWKVTTSWKVDPDSNKSFVVKSIYDLVLNMFFVGTHQEVSIKRDSFELVFALGGDEIISQKDEFTKLAEGVLDYYIDLMGGAPKPSPDNKFNKSIVIINPSSSTDGEVIGNNISLLIETDGDEMSKMISKFMFAHEFFHLWNGKSFRPTDYDCEWFKEGFTNYYTLKALYHVGILNEQSYFEILNDFFYQKYTNDDGVGKLSMTNGPEKHAHWGLIYGGGLFVGISQDMIIRNATNNEKSIDDLLRGLYKKYGGTNDSYTLEELRNTMSELSGEEQIDFFDAYIIGTNKLPLADYLIIAGLDAKIENGNLIVSKKEHITLLQQNMVNGLFGTLDTR